MEGDLSLLSIPDLLQMICLGGYSRDIHLFDGPVQLGVIAIRGGRVERCFGFGSWGEGAFYKLVNLRRGRYKVNEAHDTAGSDATLTAYSWQELLMEAARRQDEAEHIAQSAAATGRVIAFPSPAAHAVTFDLPLIPVPAPVVSPVAASPAAIPPIAAALPAAPAVAASSLAPQAPPDPASPLPAASAASGRTRPSHTTGLFGPEDDDRSGPAGSAPDITHLLEQATACYLRRDLARTEELLQQCLAMRPGDKRVLQNLERVRRKKST